MCSTHKPESARAEAIPSSVASNHSDTSTCGATAGAPADPRVDRMRDVQGERSKPPANSQTARAGCSGGNKWSSDSQRHQVEMRCGTRILADIPSPPRTTLERLLDIE